MKTPLMSHTWFGKLEMVATAHLLLQEHGWPGTEETTFMHDRNPVSHCVCLVQKVGRQKNGAPCHNHKWKVNDHQTTHQTESFLINQFPQKNLSLVSKTSDFPFLSYDKQQTCKKVDKVQLCNGLKCISNC